MRLKNVPIAYLIYVIYSLLMVINFFLTPNPYSASHSGLSGMESGIISEKMFISTQTILIISMCIIFIFIRKIKININIFFLIIILICSGLYTQSIYTHFKTYVFNVFCLFVISNIAYYDKTKLNVSEKGLNKFIKYLVSLLLLGLIATVASPNRYGYLPFRFSRISRGEITLWISLGIITLFSTFSIIMYLYYNRKIYLIFYLITFIIILSTATRASIIAILLPLLILMLIKAPKKYRFLLFIIGILVLFFFRDQLTQIFFISNYDNNIDIETILNGRLALWQFNLDTFKSNILFGSGAFFLNDLGTYTGAAVSEIGALKWFSENGILYGTIMMIISLYGLYKAILIIKLHNKDKSNIVLLIYAVMYITMFPSLTQSFSRILDINDFIFYYILFVLNYIPLKKNNNEKYNKVIDDKSMQKLL